MDIRDSQIILDEKSTMYKLDIGFYTRYFDYLVYNNSSICRHFWEKIVNVDNFKIDKNYIFWFTDFEGKIIFNIFNLDNFLSIYRIVDKVFLSSFQIKWVNYYLLVYEDFGWNIGFYSDFEDEMFEINIINKIVQVKNMIFSSVILEKEILFLPKEKVILEKWDNTNFLDILDFYYFDNLFEKNEDKQIYEDLKNLDNMTIWNYISQIGLWVKLFESKEDPKFILNIKINNAKINLNPIKKLLLTINPNSYLFYSIDNQEIEMQLLEFENITNFQIKSIDLNFQIPNNIFEFDKNFINFQKNISKLRFYLYNLKVHLNIIENTNIDVYNKNLYLAKNRLVLNTTNIEESIKIYEKIFLNLLETIKWKYTEL